MTTLSRRRVRLGYALLVAAYFLVQIYRGSPAAVKSFLEAELGLSSLQYSQLSAAFFYAYAAMQLPAGILLDLWGPGRVARGGLAVLAAAGLLHALSPGYPLLFLSRLLMGLGAGVLFLALLKFQSNHFSDSAFSTATGISTCLGNLGGVVAQAPFLALANLLCWRGAFLFLSAVTALLALLSIPIIQDAPAPETPPVMQSSTTQPTLRSFGLIFRTSAFYLPLVINLIAQGIFVSGTAWSLAYLTDVYGLSSLKSGSIAGLLPLVAAVSTLSAGRLSYRFSPRKVGLGFCLLLCLVLTILTFWPNVPLVIAGISVVLLGSSAFYSIHFGIVRKLCPQELSGVATGFVNMGTFLGAAVFPVIFGLMLEDTTISLSSAYQASFRFLFLACLIMTCLEFILPATEPSSSTRTRPLSLGQ